MKAPVKRGGTAIPLGDAAKHVAARPVVILDADASGDTDKTTSFYTKRA